MSFGGVNVLLQMLEWLIKPTMPNAGIRLVCIRFSSLCISVSTLR
jgi:hypothetical protein